MLYVTLKIDLKEEQDVKFRVGICLVKKKPDTENLQFMFLVEITILHFFRQKISEIFVVFLFVFFRKQFLARFLGLDCPEYRIQTLFWEFWHFLHWFKPWFDLFIYFREITVCYFVKFSFLKKTYRWGLIRMSSFCQVKIVYKIFVPN